MDRRHFLVLALGLGLPGDMLQKLLDTVAGEAIADLRAVEMSNVGPVALEQLQADVRGLAHAYVAQAPQPLIARMVVTLDDVRQTLQGQQRPAQRADLLFLSGQLRGLLANASLDMGDTAGAATNARAAAAFGDAIGNDGLRAWASGMESMAARWEGRLSDAVALTEAGLVYAPAGTARARLYALRARALGEMGDLAGVRRALALAEEELGYDSRDVLHDVVGGEFGFGPARFAYYTGHALQAAGDHQRGMAAAARAVELYQSGPAGERSYGCEAMSIIGQAQSLVHMGEIEGASAVLDPVLALPTTHHLTIFGKGMAQMHALLQRPEHDGLAARQLQESIQGFYEALPRPKAIAS